MAQSLVAPKGELGVKGAKRFAAGDDTYDSKADVFSVLDLVGVETTTTAVRKIESMSFSRDSMKTKGGKSHFKLCNPHLLGFPKNFSHAHEKIRGILKEHRQNGLVSLQFCSVLGFNLASGSKEKKLFENVFLPEENKSEMFWIRRDEKGTVILDVAYAEFHELPKKYQFALEMKESS